VVHALYVLLKNSAMPSSNNLTTKCLAALSTPKKGRVNVVREALMSGLLADPMFITPLVAALSDRSAVFADYIADEILPQVGVSLVKPLLIGIDALPEPIRYRHLRVIRRLAPQAAKKCARNSARAKHTKLALECIDLLSGSKSDASLLMELARNRSTERSASSYRALSGISDDFVQEFLRESLVQGIGFPEFSVAYHPNASLCATISDMLSVRLQALETGDILSKSDARHLISLVESAAGQNWSGFDEILNRCIKVAANIQGNIQAYACFDLDFAQATFEAV
jgi:hypothetical protein